MKLYKVYISFLCNTSDGYIKQFLNLKAFWFLFECTGDCRNPKVQTQLSYTTGSVLLSKSAAFILEVDLDCKEVSWGYASRGGRH